MSDKEKDLEREIEEWKASENDNDHINETWRDE